MGCLKIAKGTGDTEGKSARRTYLVGGHAARKMAGAVALVGAPAPRHIIIYGSSQIVPAAA